MNEELKYNNLPSFCNVLIIGGGVAGTSTAYHLAQAGVKDIVLIETGIPGDGSFETIKAPIDGSYRDGDFGGEEGKSFKYAARSGSACLPEPANKIKMMVNLYPSSSIDFCNHHGKDGARRYLALAAEGIRIEKSLATQVTNDEIFRSYGSLYVAEYPDVPSLRQEYELLIELNCPGIEWWDESQVHQHAGGESARFGGGIFFPNDGVINSGQYCKDILLYLEKNFPNVVTICQDTVETIDTTSDESFVFVNTVSKLQIRSNYVVLATGGLFVDPSIGGILIPCWSYLVGIKDPRPNARFIGEKGTESTWTEELYPSTPLSSQPLRTPNSINLFTWGFTHDWCMTNGYLRLSGADHFSSFKPPRMEERCRELAEWAYTKYPYLQSDEPYVEQYGIYSETPDSAPLVGTPSKNSRLCYLLGCNAWGQASLSYSASLVPGILGFQTLTEQQKEYLSLLTIRRYSLLPCVRDGK